MRNCVVEEKCIQDISMETRKKRNQFEEQGVDERIILKLGLKKQGVEGRGLDSSEFFVFF